MAVLCMPLYLQANSVRTDLPLLVPAPPWLIQIEE